MMPPRCGKKICMCTRRAGDMCMVFRFAVYSFMNHELGECEFRLRPSSNSQYARPVPSNEEVDGIRTRPRLPLLRDRREDRRDKRRGIRPGSHAGCTPSELVWSTEGFWLW